MSAGLKQLNLEQDPSYKKGKSKMAHICHIFSDKLN